MLIKKSLRGLLLTGTCLLPVAAFAQASGDNPSLPAATAPATPAAVLPSTGSYADIGAGYLSTSSSIFGRYTGLNDKGGFALGDFDWRGRDAYDSGGTRYWNFEGHDLGLTSRSFDLDYGQQGSWGVKFDYLGIPYYQSNHFVTIYDSSGKGTLNGGAPSVSTTPFWQSNLLSPYLRTTETGTQRDIFSGQFNFTGIPDWTFTAGIRHDHKEGSLEQSMIFGTGKSIVLQGHSPAAGQSSGNIVYFPMPIDYDTDRFEAKAQFSRERIQAEFKYTLSNFNDNNSSFNAIDPFQSPSVFAGNSGVAGSNNLGPAGTLIQGVYSLPPSNQAHQVSGTLAYEPTPTTKLVTTGSWGLMLQNDPFLPASMDAFSLSKVPTSISSGSLNGQVQTLFGNMTFTARPFQKTDLLASYTVDSHDNQTPRALVQATYVDAWRNYANEIGAGAANGVVPFIYSSTIQTIRAEAGYRIAPQTRLSAGYTLKITDRTASETDHMTENGFFARVNTNLAPGINGSLGWEHSIRTDSAYNGAYPWQLLGYTANENQTPSTTPGGAQPVVDLVEAPRTQNVFRARLSGMLQEDMEIGFEARYTTNHYPMTQFGVTDDHNITIGPDIAYNPTPEISTSAFYNYEQIYQNQTGGLGNASAPSATTWLGPWTQQTNDQLHTVGIRANWNPTDSRWRFAASYDFSYGDVGYSLYDTVTPALLAALGGTNPTTGQQYLILPMPNTTSQLHSLTISGEYKLQTNLSLLAGYTFERFLYDDAGLNAMSNPTQYGNVLLPGIETPSYVAHVVRLAARMKF